MTPACICSDPACASGCQRVAASALGGMDKDFSNPFRYTRDWLIANARIRAHPLAAQWIAAQYGRDWRAGRRTAVCAAGFNTPYWQEAVRRAYPHRADPDLFGTAA